MRGQTGGWCAYDSAPEQGELGAETPQHSLGMTVTNAAAITFKDQGSVGEALGKGTMQPAKLNFVDRTNSLFGKYIT